jgi:periplasmic protein TonB
MSMKYLSIFLLFICANLSAQTIDCQLIEKINLSKINTKQTYRSTSSTKSSYGDRETITEVDAERRMRMVSKRPSFGNRKASDNGGSSQSETIAIDGFIYTKNMLDNTWKYVKNPFSIDSLVQKSKQENFKSKYEGCQKMGSETIEGKNYDIIETTNIMQQGSEAPKTRKYRLWINLKDSVIKKMETTHETPNSTIKMTYVYGVEIEPITKPLNAVRDTTNYDKYKTLLTSNKKLQGNLANNKDNLSKSPFPEYKDGMKALFNFMTNNLVYPQAAKDAKVQGTVYLKFIVDTEGAISDISVARGLREDMNEAAIELMKKTSGNWHPALEFGKPIKQTYTMPVKFKLD